MGAAVVIGALIADGGYGHMDGFGWGMMGMGWFVMVVLAGIAVWVAVRVTAGGASRDQDPTASGLQILADRYARGEIDEDEYRRRSGELRS